METKVLRPNNRNDFRNLPVLLLG